MRQLGRTLALLLVLAMPRVSTAHPAPFSYVDIQLAPDGVSLTIVAHIFDLGHDLEIGDGTRLLAPGAASTYGPSIAALLQPRIAVAADGRFLACAPTGRIEAIPARQSVKTWLSCPAAGTPGQLQVTALLFPYDPAHQTFLNIYERDTLTTQAILDSGHVSFEYFAGTRQGAWAVVKKFVPAGIHHILIGPDHLLFLVGLLLLGGTLRQLVKVVTAFTIAHSITLSLAALSIVSPPARIIEPAIALSIVYVGADNLLVREGRDVRAWIAFAFGFIHGFGFASVLREMGLPPRALGWSLFSFNVGVEIGQLLVVVVVATAFAALRARSETAGRRLAFAGSLAVIAAGTFWFIQRVFFPGGIS